MNEGIVVYDAHQPGPITPVAQIKQNLSIYSGQKWNHYRIEYLEGQPLGSQSIIDMMAIAPIATVLAANGTLAKRVIAQLRANINELLHFRWRPLEALEGLLWEQPNKSRYESRGLASRVDWRSETHDPYLAATTFFSLGIGTGDRDFNIEVRNPMGFTYPQARFEFSGYRYVLSPVDIPETYKPKMDAGDMETIRKVMGATTFIIAEGRAA